MATPHPKKATDSSAETPCPICGEPVGSEPRGAAYPFCSSRCRMADLGRWFDGKYAIVEPPDIESPGDVDE